MSTDPDEGAFAVPSSDENCFCPGLTKREHFAGLAMQGLLANSEYYPDDLAKESVDLADALIAALNKPVAPIPSEAEGE